LRQPGAPGMSRRALGVSAAAQAVAFVASFTSVIAVSRILTPAEIGVFSVAISVQGIAHVFREFGVSQYLVQAQEVSSRRFRAAFTLTLGFSWLIALLLFGIRTPLAAFYAHPGVAEVLALLALNFVLIPFGSPSLAMLRRELRFDALAGIRIANAVISCTVTVGAALLGESYLSMAWGALAGHLTNLALLAFIRPAGLLTLPTFTGLSELLRFGSLSSAAALVTEIGNSAADLILARTLGFSAVAYYSRAAGLRDILLVQLHTLANGVHFPTFADAIRGGEDPAALYRRAIGYLLAITVPALAVIALLADPLIRFFFGPQWGVSAPLASMLCVFSIITAPFALAHLSLVAAGQVGRVLRVAMCIQGARILALLSSIWLPLEQVVALLGLVALIEAGAYQRQLRAVFGLGLGALGREWLSALGIMLPTIAAPLGLLLFALLWPAHRAPDLVTLTLAALGAAVGWRVGTRLTGHPIHGEVSLLLRKLPLPGRAA
jgi:O-antigen/teichoic acid export membrane protein